jgi:hypothetical protein
MEPKEFPNQQEMRRLESIKLAYETPKLTEYGSLAELTQAAGGTYKVDGGIPGEWTFTGAGG